MNRAYRLVWSHTRQIWIAASEIARAHGTGKGMFRAGTLAAVLAFASPAA